jgi:cupin-like protein
MNLPTSSA